MTGGASPVPIACHNKSLHGQQFCLEECEAAPDSGYFAYARVETPAGMPPRDERVVDVAVLDMNHGWPNLGHDSLVHAVQDATCDLIPRLTGTGLRVRALSFEVRQRHMIPEAPGGRFALYLGTGGPGHIDPHQNDGSGAGTQGIVEDPAWEPPLFRLFDRIQADPASALLAVCHTFGVMCRWSGVAQPVLRGAEKGGKSAGILENVLTPEGLRHPWFARLAEELPDGRRLPVVDHRLFDLIPDGPLPPETVAIGRETRGVGGPAGDALTMLEFARDAQGEMPRVFAVNHHPEIVDRERQRLVLARKRERGEVTEEWYHERLTVLEATHPVDPLRDRRLHLTSDYTLLAPLRFHLYRQVRQRAQALGVDLDLSEDEVPAQVVGRPGA
jgi:hypothetical protein